MMNDAIRQAQEIYRGAWDQYCLAKTDHEKKQWEQVMDGAQPECTSTGGPGPEWEAFIDTLPGFRDFWARFAREARGMLTVIEEKYNAKPGS